MSHRHGPCRKLCSWIWILLLILILIDVTFVFNGKNNLSQGHVLRSAVDKESRDDSFFLNNLHSSQPADGEFEIAHISFVTQIRHKRDLSQNEFHIIKLFRQVANKTMEIHLVKRDSITSPDFTVVIKNGDQVENEESYGLNSNDTTRQDCLYDGVISLESEGKVAFSVCGKQPGFSGIIVTNDGNWIIEPHKDYGKDSKNSSANGNDDDNVDNILNESTATIPHIIFKMNTSSHSNQSLESDELHVPVDELEKAAELARNTEKDRFDSNDNPNDADKEESNEETDDIPVLAHNEKIHQETANIQIQLFARRSSPRRTRRQERTSLLRRGSNTRTSKAASTKSPKKVTVEIAVFADSDFYDEMKIRYPKDTMRKIKDYILTMVHAMDLLYQHESLGTDLHFKLVHLEIQKKKPSKLNSHGGKAKSYLTSFCDYAGDLNINNRIWDHALMLTGHDLIEEGASSTAGLAWAGTMCYRYYSCSISEGTQFGSVFIITHEIGHSMGMEHDGLGVSKSCDEDKYLMSPTTGPGKVTWSTCSGQNLRDFLEYGTSELRGGKSAVKPVCMTESSRESKNIEYSNESLPGERYDSTKQCVLSMGKKYTPVMRKDNPFNNICSMLYCGNGTHAISTHPALDGTQCSTGKHCQGGQCVDKV